MKKTALDPMDRGVSRRSLLAATVAGLAVPLARTRAAGRYPDKQVTLVSPYSAGGPVDIVARMLAQKLTERWGQAVIVENRAGASGAIGTEHVSKARPDGYTLLACNAGEIVILPTTRSSLPYDPLKDLTPITQLVSGPMVLAVKGDSPFKTLQDLLAGAKKQPGRLTYGSVGPGSISHVAGAMLESLGHVKLLHVPYKGAGPVITDLLGGHVDMAFIGVSVASPLLASGALRALGVTTTKRSGLLPDLPAISEILPNFEVNSWYGLMAPAKTPKALVDQIYQDTKSVVEQPEFAESLRQRGSDIVMSTPDQFRDKIKDELVRFAAVAKAAGINIQESN
jgi:tripartite-type tricarboxylate transporter receptor subunit TctC